MKVLGITAEYDPFHNGHRYHLKTAKATVCPDITLCVMSGDITQRGELAVLDKWIRARIAVDQGLDMVLELPFAWACSPAQSFASGAVDMLVLAGATHIAFGCEAEDPDRLTELARLQISEAERIEDAAREEMRSGISHVKARQNASSRIIGEELTRLSLAPNNILALEYLKRMMHWREQGKDIEAVPIRRMGSGYKDVSAGEGKSFGEDASAGAGKFAGGSAIREMIDAGWDVSGFIPYELKDYCGEVREQSGPGEAREQSGPGAGWTDLGAARAEMLKQLKGIVLRSSAEELAKIRFVGEGIENRLIREITEADTYKELLKRMTSRRYTTSTIRRMLICILLGITREMVATEESAVCGRVLALDEAGRRLIASEPGLPFIANINRTEGLSEAAAKNLEMDVRAADLYNLLTGRDVNALSDHRQKPYIR